MAKVRLQINDPAANSVWREKCTVTVFHANTVPVMRVKDARNLS